MAVLDSDIAAELTAVDVASATRLSPAPRPEHEVRDSLALLERKRACAYRELEGADAVEACCEKRRLAAVNARARAGALKWHLDPSWRQAEGDCRGGEGPPPNSSERAHDAGSVRAI